MWLTTQSPPIENALHRIMRVIIFPHDDKKKRQVWIIISSKVPMCMQTHQLTTGPNGITSGFTYLTQDFQNPPVLCMIYTFRFDIFSYSGSLPPGTHFPYLLWTKNPPPGASGSIFGYCTNPPVPMDPRLQKPIPAILPMHHTSLISMLCQSPQLTSYGGTGRPC
jgi:hypothetical protein